MLFTTPPGRPALPVALFRPSALRRWREGISLWLAVLFMLSLHPLYAGAGLQPLQTPAPAAGQAGCPQQMDAERVPEPCPGGSLRGLRP